MTRQPTFEVVRTDAGWHARFRAANGEIVWTTEVYTRRRAAYAAIESIVRCCYGWVEDGAVMCLSSRDSWNKRNRPVANVRQLDERDVVDGPDVDPVSGDEAATVPDIDDTGDAS